MTQNVMCQDGYGLVKLGFVRRSDSMAYTFSCAPTTKTNCQKYSTNWTDIDKGRTEYLDRQVVWANAPSQILKGFKLQSATSDQGSGQILYDYVICQ